MTLNKFSIVLIFLLGLFPACTENSKNEVKNESSVDAKLDCIYSYDKAKTKVFWMAYKTSDKLKVVGQFEEFSTNHENQQFSSLEELMNGLEFTINSGSSVSGDEIRDLSLRDYFFKLFTENFKIKGSLSDISEKSALATIDVYGVANSFALNYSMENNILKMKGKFSLEEFGAKNAFNSIHQKCFDLHKGVTWDEVDVLIEVPILTDCK